MAPQKKRLSMNLSFLALIDSTKQKSAKSFDEPNGVVGLRILAALNDDGGSNSPIFFNGSKFSTKSNPIPIGCNQGGLCDRKDMELCEEYTCVISHLGENLVEKREYFEADFLGNNRDEFVAETFLVADYLSSCFLCNKLLHGLDIFMYRGEKAFCSAECRFSQISIDEKAEKREKRQNRIRKQVECSVSPCSGALQFFAGVAAA